MKLPTAPALSQAEEFLLHISQATTNGYSAHLNEVKPEATTGSMEFPGSLNNW